MPREEIKSSVLAMFILRYLFLMQVKLLSRWLDIRVWISGAEVRASNINLGIITL